MATNSRSNDKKKRSHIKKKATTANKKAPSKQYRREGPKAPSRSKKPKQREAEEEYSDEEVDQDPRSSSRREHHQPDSDEEEEELHVDSPAKQVITPPTAGKRSTSEPNNEEYSGDEEEIDHSDDNSQGSDVDELERSPTSSRGSAAEITKEITEECNAKVKMSRARIEPLKKENKKLKDELKGCQKEIQKKDAEIAKLQSSNEDLLQKYQVALSKSTGKKKDEDVKNKAMVSYLTKQSKRNLWRTIKFLGDDEQLYVVAAKVLDMYGPGNLRLNGNETDDQRLNKEVDREEWIELYATDIRTAINDQRSYVQAEQKKHALVWMRNDGTNFRPLPTCEDIWLVVQRKLEDDDEERAQYLQDLFDWWVNCHVAACAGSTHFGDKTRRTENVSVALVKDCDSKKLAVPPSTEAMAYVMYENCYDKWQEIHKWKEIDKNLADVPKYSSKRHEETKQWKGKYSDSCNGQNPYGGWDDEGLERFEEVKKAIGTMRKEEADRLEPIETACCERLMTAFLEAKKRKAEAEGKQLDDSSPKKKRKKTKAKHNKPRVVITVDED